MKDLVCSLYIPTLRVDGKVGNYYGFFFITLAVQR